MSRCPSTRQGLRCKRKAGHPARLHGDGDFVWEDDMHPPAVVPSADPGDALRLARERSGHTMGDLARFLGVPVTLVSAIERGNVGVLRAYLEAHAHVPAAADAGRADRGEVDRA